MEPLAPDNPLEWVQPALAQRRYELRSGERTYASLAFRSAFGSLALGSAASGRWTFKRSGFFRTKVTIRLDSEADDVAVYYPAFSTSHGELIFTEGQKYTWRVANFFATRFTLENQAGETVLSYQSGREEGHLGDLFKQQARLSIAPAAWENPDLPLLILLSWYLVILHHEDSAAIASTAAAS